MKVIALMRKNLTCLFFLSAFFLQNCASVTTEEKAETLERILRLEQEKSLLAKSAEITPTPTPTATPESPPELASQNVPQNMSAPPGISQKPAPNLMQPDQLELPLPRGVVHSDLVNFKSVYSDLMGAYQPLSDEWLLYSKVFATSGRSNDEEILSLKIRVRENLARSHWLFVWGISEASSSMLHPEKQIHFLVDRQSDFVDRMNVLIFLMMEMQAAGMKTDHRSYLRNFYKHINLRYFKRPLRDREVQSFSQSQAREPSM